MDNKQLIIDKAKESLLHYCKLINPNYKTPNHIKIIADRLSKVERGEIKRLIITIPPRHGKSMLTSQYFPAWFLGRNPNKYIITSTYGQELCNDFGRKVRDQLQDPVFNAVFSARMRSDVQSMSRIEMQQGGSYFGVGAGGAITGRGAHLLLIDDPIKGREDADSELMRAKLWDWYRSVAYTRLMPDAAVIVISTRWHETDLVGSLLTEQEHEGWLKIDLPALNALDQPLWPEQYSKMALESIRSTLGEYEFYCLYQQNPIPKEGIIFKEEWLKQGHANDYAVIYVGVDPAISKSDNADETAICVLGVGYGETPIYYEIETLHGKWDFNEQIEKIKEVKAKYKPDLIGVESVAYQKALCDVLNRLNMPIVELKADQDKVRRAMSVSHFFGQDRVRVNSIDLKRQLLSFRGKNEKNDLVDALVNCLRLIRDWSSERYMKQPESKYKGLDPLNSIFQRVEDEMKKKNAGELKEILYDKTSSVIDLDYY